MKITILICFLLSSLFSHADVVRIVDDPIQAMKLRLHLIEEAQTEIQISYFIFHKDKTSMELLSLLREKARSGVKVRLILDEMFNKIPRPVQTHLAQEGIEILNFNTFQLLRPIRSVKFRLHDKLFIVDRTSIVMGGRNIQDDYFARAEENYEDRDILVQGQMAADAAKYFDTLWVAPHLKPSKPAMRELEEAGRTLDDHLAIYRSQQGTFSTDQISSPPVNVDRLTFLRDGIGRKKKHFTGTSKALFTLMENAKESIIIDSPYLMLTRELKAMLKRTLARGVRVRILTNSLKTNDGVVAHAGYLSDRKKFVRMGVELYEFFGEDRFHSKSIVIDGEIAVVGSYNFDPRSQNLNTETMAAIWDPEVARLLTESMDENLKISMKIGRSGRPEGEPRKFPGVSTRKLVLTKLIQFLVVPWAKSLL